jgi:hypothetical protein
MTGITKHIKPGTHWIISIAIVSVLSLLMACEKTEAVKLPPHVPKLVVHGYVETGTAFNIAIGRTFPSDVLMVDTQTYVRDAIVVLYEDGVIKDTLRYYQPTRYYRSAVIAAVGKTYRLVVSAPGFATVEATSKAGLPVPLTRLVFNRRARTSTEGQILDDVNFTFNDPPGEANYYIAELNNKTPYFYSFCAYSYDPVIDKFQANLNPFEGASCIRNDEIFFSDQQFNGQTREISVSGNSDILETVTDATTGAVYRPYIKRKFVSKELYQYTKDAIAIDNTTGDPFSIPPSIKGNVNGGYGIFAVYATLTDTLR